MCIPTFFSKYFLPQKFENIVTFASSTYVVNEKFNVNLTPVFLVGTIFFFSSWEAEHLKKLGYNSHSITFLSKCTIKCF